MRIFGNPRMSRDFTSTAAAAAEADAASTNVNADSVDDGNITNGSVITFHDIHYSVQVKNPDQRCGKISKEILTNIRQVNNC